MKKLLILSVLVIGVLPGFAQCEKDVTLSTSKTEYLDETGRVQRTVEEASTVEIGKSDVVIIPGGNTDHKMNGKIQSKECNWNVPYKEGKSVVKARFEDPSGNAQNATLTLEGIEGKLTLLMEIAEMPTRKIRVSVNSADEKQ